MLLRHRIRVGARSAKLLRKGSPMTQVGPARPGPAKQCCVHHWAARDQGSRSGETQSLFRGKTSQVFLRTTNEVFLHQSAGVAKKHCIWGCIRLLCDRHYHPNRGMVVNQRLSMENRFSTALRRCVRIGIDPVRAGKIRNNRIVRALAPHDFSFWNEGMAEGGTQ